VILKIVFERGGSDAALFSLRRKVRRLLAEGQRRSIMAKARTQGMHHKGDRKQRGRTNIDNVPGLVNPAAPRLPIEERRETNRPITGGGGKHRGDRNNPRPDVKTRKR
jgi:hypothetical protein